VLIRVNSWLFSGQKPGFWLHGWRWLFLLILFTGCEAEPPPPPPPATPTSPPPTLRIGLTDSAAGLADLVAEPFAAQNQQAALQFITANNRTLLADLAGGQLEAVLVHYIPANSENWFNPVALDGLVIVVHPDNPVESLSLAEIQAIFNGRLDNWSAVGGPDLAIQLVSREQGAGTRTLLGERILLEQRLAITAEIVSGNEQMLEMVAANPAGSPAGSPAAVGYSMMGSVSSQVKSLLVEGLAATPESTADQSYPLTSPLYFVTLEEPAGELRAFLAWLQSPAGQEIIGQRYGRVR
jgi:phosphate transport system substrate-binding protein